MALWFCEIRAREVTFMTQEKRRTHAANSMLSRGGRGRQQVVNLDELAMERANGGW